MTVYCWSIGNAPNVYHLAVRPASSPEKCRPAHCTARINNALRRSIDPARLAYPLQVVCVEWGEPERYAAAVAA